MTPSLAGRTRRSRALGVLVLVPALAVAAGCGGSTQSTPGESTTKAAAPTTPQVSLPAGVTLTKPGTELGFGQPATVAFAPNAQKATAVQLTVQSVQTGSIADLAAYQLDDATKTATPYYATVLVKNVGDGEIGKSSIPLWGLASDDTLIGSSGFTTPFPDCVSEALPASFAAGAETTTCLMYLVPQGGTMVGISYRPVMSDDAIVWKGAIAPPTPK